MASWIGATMVHSWSFGWTIGPYWNPNRHLTIVVLVARQFIATSLRASFRGRPLELEGDEEKKWSGIESLLEIEVDDCLCLYRMGLLGWLRRLAPTLRLRKGRLVDLLLTGCGISSVGWGSVFCCIPLTVVERACTCWIRMLYWFWCGKDSVQG